MIDFIKNMFKRNYAISQVQNFRSPAPVYSNWGTKRAVEEGYKTNPWVYRSINLIVKSLSTIPWIVKRDSEFLPEHHLSKLFNSPNPKISNNDLWELFYSWLELSGNAYGMKIKVNGQTQEIWPVSPDRITPMQGVNIAEWINSYVLDIHNKSTKKIFDPSEILHLKFFNPSDPFIGIGPLQACAKTVDTDNDQMDWQKSTMQNRGVIDGIFTFERPFETPEDAADIAETLNKKYSGKKNARKLGVLGGNAKYHRTALTPQESDFSTSRKDNRDEIFITFGIPPQLGGSQESSTYNNFEVSSLIFWFSTLIPKLDDTKSTLNFDFKEELKPNEKICYDLSGIQAIRKAMLDQTETAEKLFKMGVPFEKVNRIFDFGVDEFEGWEKSYVAQGRPLTEIEKVVEEDKEDLNRSKFTLIEYRNISEDLEKKTLSNEKIFNDLLETQKNLIFDAIDKGEGQDAELIIASTQPTWIEKVEEIYVNTGVEFGSKLIKESKRQSEDPLTQAIEMYLEEEMVVLNQVSLINATTSQLIVDHVKEGLKEGLTSAQTQQSILDAGIFPSNINKESRALMLSRTITGNAANLGQYKGAGLVGATHKTWDTAGFNVRDSHKKLDNKKIPINDFFIVGDKREQARYPLDNNLSPGERVNCRCSLSYSIED